MLPPPNRLDKARPGAKLKKLNTVKRYVRLYSNDLVKTGAGWDLGNSKEWNRVTSSQPGLKMGGPRYSDSYRKHMGLSTNEYPETGLPPSPNVSLTPSSSIVEECDTVDPLAPKEDQLRFRSLTDLRWGEFESLGFLASSNATQKRLEFDLNEGARNVCFYVKKFADNITLFFKKKNLLLTSRLLKNEQRSLGLTSLRPVSCATMHL